MKKALSLILSILMVLSTFSCLSVTAFALDGEKTLITNGETLTFSTSDNLDLYFTPEEDGYYELYSHYDCENQEAFDPQCYLYDAEECQINYDDDGGNGYNFKVKAYLSANVEYHYSIDVRSGSDEVSAFSVTLQKGVGATSIEFSCDNTVTYIENSNGYLDYSNEEEQNFFRYYLELHHIFNVGDTASVVYSDGSADTFTYNGAGFYNAAGEELKLTVEENQYETHWVKGAVNKFTVTADAVSVEFFAEIIDDPVESIEFIPVKPVTVTENVNGYIANSNVWNEETGENDYVEYFHYFTPDSIWEEGNRIVINYKNGDQETYTYQEYYYNESNSSWGYINEDGKDLTDDIRFSDNQGAENPWTVNNTYKLYILLPDTNCQGVIDVTVVPDPVESIEFIPVKPVTVTENVDGSWLTDYVYNEETETYDLVEYFNYEPSLWQDGNQFIINNKDGSREVYTYQKNYYGEQSYTWEYVTEDGKALQGNLRFDYEQSAENAWTVNNTYKVNVKLSTTSCTGSVDVTVVSDPIESIQFVTAKPITVMENTDGYEAEEQIFNEETEEYETVKYFKYYLGDKIWAEGNRIVISYKNGESVTYAYGSYYSEEIDEYTYGFVNEQGEACDIQYITDNQDYENQWEVNNTYTVGLRLETERTINVSVTVIPDPIESVEIIPAKPLQLVDGIDGYIRNYICYDPELGEYEIQYFYYNYCNFIENEGSKIIYYYKDGSEEVYTFTSQGWEFVTEDGKVIEDIYQYDSQDYDNQWQAGNTYTGCVYIDGRKVEVEVTTVENPIKSISYKWSDSHVIYENTKGDWLQDGNNEDYFYYSGYNSPCQGDTFTVNYATGKTVVYTFDEESYCFISPSGDILNFGWSAFDSQYSDHWFVGENNTYTLCYNGRTCEVKVNLVESPVKSISYKPLKTLEIYENTGRISDDGVCYYDLYWDEIFSTGDKITVNYKDNTSKTYTCKNSWLFVAQDGEALNTEYLSFDEEQEVTPWTKGGNNKITVSYIGANTQIGVNIVENPVKSVNYQKKNPMKFYENDSGRYNDEIWISAFEKGDILTVNYKDGTKEVFSYKGDIGFVNQKGESINERYLDYEFDFDKNPWVVGTNNYYEVSYAGIKAKVPVTIVKNNIKNAVYTPVKAITLRENTNGYTEIDEKGEEYFSYYLPYNYCADMYGAQIGDKITVTYTDNSTEVYVLGKDGFVSQKTGEILRRCYYGSDYYNRYKNHWVKGADNSYPVCLFDKYESNIKVNIVNANPVKDIKITQSAVTETDPYGYGKDSVDLKYLLGFMTFEITYQDGSKETVKGSDVANIWNGTYMSGDRYQKYASLPVFGKYTTELIVAVNNKDVIENGDVIIFSEADSENEFKHTVKIESHTHSYTNGVCSCGDWKNASATPTVTVANVSTGVKISWNKIEGATGYIVYYKSGSGWARVGTTTDTSTIDTSVKSGTTRTYTVKAYRTVDGKTVNSKYNNTGKSIKYLALTKLSSVANATNGVKITWNKVSGAEGYLVYRKTTGGWTKIATV
ncbi:MAG: hypothetical protein ACI4IF_08425, partial [Acutalibacteraceae bacterium]